LLSSTLLGSVQPRDQTLASSTDAGWTSGTFIEICRSAGFGEVGMRAVVSRSGLCFRLSDLGTSQATGQILQAGNRPSDASSSSFRKQLS
jgi:hypothetical protein